MTFPAIEQAVLSLPPGKLRVALSGGMDSTVLLHAVAEHLRKTHDLARLAAHHCDHRLIKESKDMARHCQMFAESLGVNFQCDVLDVRTGGNTEAEARRARYACLQSALAQDETLLLAQHADDQAETLLMRLMRGAGGDLLRGMPRERALGQGRLMRPFLHLPRSLLRAYSEAHHLKFVEDPSNQDISRDRNFTRHRVLPRLAERWPDAVESISRASQAMNAEFAAFNALVEARVEEVVADARSLSIDAILRLPENARVPVLRGALKRLGIHALTDSHLVEILTQLNTPVDRRPEFTLDIGTRLVRFGGKLTLREAKAVDHAARYTWSLHEHLSLPHGRLTAEANATRRGSCLEPLLETLEVRFAEGGERLRVRGMRRKVKRLLKEADVPPWQRPGWPLLYSGDDLAAVAGITVDDAFACDEGWLIDWSAT